MKTFSQLREAVAMPEKEPREPLRTKILNRGKRPTTEDAELIETESTSVIEILKQINESVSGRITIVQEGVEDKQAFIDYETANYLLSVYEDLTPEHQSLFENTLIENIDNLDEIAMYCETVLENQKD